MKTNTVLKNTVCFRKFTKLVKINFAIFIHIFRNGFVRFIFQPESLDLIFKTEISCAKLCLEADICDFNSFIVAFLDSISSLCCRLSMFNSILTSLVSLSSSFWRHWLLHEKLLVRCTLSPKCVSFLDQLLLPPIP